MPTVSTRAKVNTSVIACLIIGVSASFQLLWLSNVKHQRARATASRGNRRSLAARAPLHALVRRHRGNQQLFPAMADVVTFDEPAASSRELDLVKDMPTIGQANLVDKPVTVTGAVGRRCELDRGIE